MNTKTADTKGRIALGLNNAGKTFIVKEIAGTGDILLTLGTVIPERELWLFHNQMALESVKRGLEEASRGDFGQNPPDLQAVLDFAQTIPDESE